ncbi:hypothetical protein ABLI10_004550 [Escherichia coli]|uniref:Uncharacterized protein n=1 Tax=Escherichia coli TaxID=562 RepID=A0A0B0VCL1_ECOLX|nr:MULTISPECIES: hypothetical protein [Escherichia]EHQ5529351.1 hypothetical protein [Escherichia coli O2]EHY2112045.1 hypothetical protein [Escherichia coli O157]EJT2829772.1 hypothetical protein [Shigella boydii]EKF4355157.1 hypothetical protein [Escherichia coli O136]EKH5947999.1 hypothetical protein [Escherichia coli O103]EKM2496205.1 hypothetical protein [Escherichia coli O26]ELJ1060835.1 hypothetical protein [Escherichia coli O168]HDQ6536988.1 hypothetical protein [Escherichia coli O3
MDEERVFSLSYEQLTRIAEKNIRECGLDSQSARCISELKASALLWLWYRVGSLTAATCHGLPLPL